MYKLLKDRINIKILCLSIVFAMISFFTDNIIFDKIQIQRQHYLTLKLIYVILIVCIGQLICKLVYAIKRSESVRTAVKFAGICFGILMVFLFLTYPGIWLWDNMEMLNIYNEIKWVAWILHAVFFCICINGNSISSGSEYLSDYHYCLCYGENLLYCIWVD